MGKEENCRFRYHELTCENNVYHAAILFVERQDCFDESVLAKAKRLQILTRENEKNMKKVYVS